MWAILINVCKQARTSSITLEVQWGRKLLPNSVIYINGHKVLAHADDQTMSSEWRIAKISKTTKSRLTKVFQRANAQIFEITNGSFIFWSHFLCVYTQVHCSTNFIRKIISTDNRWLKKTGKMSTLSTLLKTPVDPNEASRVRVATTLTQKLNSFTRSWGRRWTPTSNRTPTTPGSGWRPTQEFRSVLYSNITEDSIFVENKSCSSNLPNLKTTNAFDSLNFELKFKS